MSILNFSRTLILASLSILAAAAPAGAFSTGLANPASQLCSDLGGRVEMLSGTGGQVGFCRLDGALVEEWTLLREVNGESQAALDAFLNHVPFHAPKGRGGANPAALYCTQVGGTVTQLRQQDGGTVGACTFADRSIIEEWTLFRGPSDSANQDLAAVVQGD